MKIALQKNADRGQADYGWLKTKYSFSFAEYYDPEKMGFGKLRVINDDTIAGGGGFATHHHDNMEIITIVFAGALAHQDSLGNGGVIGVGDVQVMSAGRGIDHSEYNNSPTAPAALFQIWIETKEQNISPSYEQKHFDPADFKNKVKIVASGYGDEDALYIHQLARVAFIQTDRSETISYQIPPGSGLYIMNVAGTIKVGEHLLESRDAAAISASKSIAIKMDISSQALLLEVPL